jgi:hypothetical protein
MIRSCLFALFLVLASCKGLFEPEPARAGSGTDSPAKKDSLAQSDSLSPAKPAVLTLDSLSQPELSVSGVGGVETARLGFTARDSAGIRVGGRFIIQFFKSCPDSGGTLLTLYDTTHHGHVECLFKSGTVSGTCAVTARYIENLSQVIAASQVVRLLISGGPVAAGGFSLVPERHNVPLAAGGNVALTAFCFDRYGNPSVPVMVYFSASAGGVGAGGLTDSTGRVTSFFTMAGNPPDSMKAVVTASTRNGAGDLLAISGTLLFSGAPGITITHAGSPSDTFALARGGSTALHVAVHDAKGHPLSAGAHIVMLLSGGGELVGNSDITLPDIISGFTDFEIMVRDDGSGARYVQFIVDVTGPNGNCKSGLWGRVF